MQNWIDVMDAFITNREAGCEPNTVRYYRTMFQPFLCWLEKQKIDLPDFRKL